MNDAYTGIGIALAVFALILGLIAIFVAGPIATVGLAVLGIVIGIVGLIMTLVGVKVLD